MREPRRASRERSKRTRRGRGGAGGMGTLFTNTVLLGHKGLFRSQLRFTKINHTSRYSSTGCTDLARHYGVQPAHARDDLGNT